MKSIEAVTHHQLCTGCGVCAYLEPEQWRMVDDAEAGRRPLPVLNGAGSGGNGAALAACPGHRLAHDFDRRDEQLDRSLMGAWGQVREVWEGYAADPAIRWAGSSGGAATALALHALERRGFHGVLHIAAREDVAYLNRTVLSKTREELLLRTGSRYAPASPCDGLQLIEDAAGPCVFIGKPCDVAAAQAAASLRPRLQEKLGLTIAFFCAGTPSTRGTIELMRRAGVDDLAAIHSVRYRGNGWPGRWVVGWRDSTGQEREASLSYAESWGFLQRYRQWRCAICPDHSGEFADISVGDPWYRPVDPGEAGKSLIVVRTARGAEFLRAASKTGGNIILERRDASLLPRSQPNLLRTRGRLWGQLVALRFSSAAVPRYHGFPTLRLWLTKLSTRQRIASIVGTWRRLRSKGLTRRARRRLAGGAAA